MKSISKAIRTNFIVLALLIVSLPLGARPAARSTGKMVWHEGKQRIVLHGGQTRADSSRTRYFLNDTWEWTGNIWIQTYPDNPPPGRGSQVMVYDSIANRIIMFGGTFGVDPDDDDVRLVRDDTWALVEDEWKVVVSQANPQARQLAGGAFDSDLNRTVLFGGFDETGEVLSDTWVLEGDAWRELPDGPHVRTPLLVYDPARKQTLMLGADDEGSTLMYELVDEVWVQLTPENLPPCVLFGGMTYEKRFTRVLFQGGACLNAATVAESWLWHGDDWAKLTPTLTPGFITGFSLANDPNREETILFAGVDFNERSSTYRFRDNTWNFKPENHVPGGRSLFAMVADPVRDVTWLFGGLDDVGQLLNDHYMLRGGVWTRLRIEDGPRFCFNPLGAWHPGRERMVLFCDNGDLWEWDGEVWYDFSSTNITDQPGDRRFAQMIYDENIGKIVLYGGFDEFNYLTDVWLWDGASWTEVENKPKDSPPGRGLAAMFYDGSSRRTIIYGGIGRPTIDDAVTRYSDMWAFDGTNWTELTPSNMPPARYGPQVVYNPDSGNVVMFGGKSELELYINETWLWNGSNWTELNAANPPSPRMNGLMVMDPFYEIPMLYGGYAGYYFSEIWTLDSGGWTVRPYRGSRDSRPVRRPPVAEPSKGQTAFDGLNE